MSGSALTRPTGAGVGQSEEHEREVDVEQTFDRTVTEGTRRLSRPWAPLVATGLVGAPMSRPVCSRCCWSFTQPGRPRPGTYGRAGVLGRFHRADPGTQ
jgi:hypothetical protein